MKANDDTYNNLKEELIRLSTEGECEEAKEIFEEAEIAIKFRSEHHFDNVSKKIKKIAESVEKSREILKVIKSVGYAYFSSNEYDKAFECFDEILKVQPGDIDAIEKTIESLRYGRRFDDADKK